MARKTLVTNNSKPRPLINVGATIDIPTCSITTGAKGEKIINGGLSSIIGVVGLGNRFKSTILHFFMLRAMDRIEDSVKDKIFAHTYDSEDNMSLNLDRFDNLANRICEYLPKNPIMENIWVVISKSAMSANKWIKEILYKLVEDKTKDKDAMIEFECFFDRETNKPLKMLYPTFIEIDSLTEFEPESTMDQLEKLDLEKTNMLFMQQGLFKSKILKELPRLSNKANIYFLVTAHIGTKKDVGGNIYNKPDKALQYLKQDEIIKGVSDKINFLTTHLWKANSSTLLIHQATKQPLFPRHKDDIATDLNLVKLQQFRSKTGTSGFVLELVVSQSEGVLPSLTEFYYLKQNKYGFEGNDIRYQLVLLPDLTLTRTTIRPLLDSNPILRRAVNITSELHQLSVYRSDLRPYMCDIKTLYEDLIKLGYDWNILLKSRGWWTPKQYTKELPPYLSTVDLLYMRKEEYVPYWLDKDKKVKKEWIKHFEEKENE